MKISGPEYFVGMVILGITLGNMYTAGIGWLVIGGLTLLGSFLSEYFINKE